MNGNTWKLRLGVIALWAVPPTLWGVLVLAKFGADATTLVFLAFPLIALAAIWSRPLFLMLAIPVSLYVLGDSIFYSWPFWIDPIRDQFSYIGVSIFATTLGWSVLPLCAFARNVQKA